MLEKDEIIGTYRFCDTANDRELVERIDQAQRTTDVLPRGSEEHRDAVYLLRIMREELSARLWLQQRHAMRG